MSQIIIEPLFSTVNNLVDGHIDQTKSCDEPYSLGQIQYYVRMETKLIIIG